MSHTSLYTKITIYRNIKIGVQISVNFHCTETSKPHIQDQKSKAKQSKCPFVLYRN